MSDQISSDEKVEGQDPFRPDRLITKYTTEYVELYDVTLHRMIESGLNPELLKTRNVAGLLKMDDGKWLAILKYDLRKDMGGTSL